MSQLIFDAHLDLSMNAMELNRDLTQPLQDIRDREKCLNDHSERGKGTVSLCEMRKGRIGICVATMIARYVQPGNPLSGWHSQQQAWAQTQGQRAWYRTMEEKGEMVPINNSEELSKQISRWENAVDTHHLPIGYVLSLEGADSLVNMHYLERAYNYGLRALGPAHYGPGVYAYGTDSKGGLGPKGRELLKVMEQLNIILDVTHLCDESFWDALKHFHGPLWASHNNCRTLVPDNRQFSDEQIKVLLERGAVIGATFDARMLIPGWVKGKSTPAATGVNLGHVVDHIDHVCQIAGNAHHAAIGSDLDGGFGKEQCPGDLDSIADLQRIPGILKTRGYADEDIENIMFKNWIRFLKEAWA